MFAAALSELDHLDDTEFAAAVKDLEHEWRSIEHAANPNLPFADFKLVVKRWVQMADPDGAYKDRTTAHEGRDASLHESEEGVHLRADGGTAAVSAGMAEIFERFRTAEFLTDSETTVAEHGASTSAAHMARTNAASTRSRRSSAPPHPHRSTPGCRSRPSTSSSTNRRSKSTSLNCSAVHRTATPIELRSTRSSGAARRPTAPSFTPTTSWLRR